jgi:hypothetical protein
VRPSLAEITRRQRAARRTILVKMDLPADQWGLLLKQYRWGVRRAMRHAAQGDSVAARAALAHLWLFLWRAEKHPLELVHAIEVAQRLQPAIRLINERNPIEHPYDDLDALRGPARVANLFGHMRAAADRVSKRNQDAARLTPHPKDPLRHQVIGSMARCRGLEGYELKNYLDAKGPDSTEEVKITPPKHDKKTYLVEYTDASDRKSKKRVTLGTLRSWWTQAKKEPKPPRRSSPGQSKR